MRPSCNVSSGPRLARSVASPPAKPGAPASPGRKARGLGSALATPALLAAGLLGCGGVIDPDPYLGTVDPSAFATQVRFATGTANPQSACLVPRRGWGGTAGTTETPWIYLGPLTASQLDLANAADPTKALPPSVYQLTGCDQPEGRGEMRTFDPRLDNYLRNVQYPVLATGFVPALAGTAGEPTNLATYRPFHVVVPAQIQPDLRDRMGCNDVKSERSLLERAGWDRESKQFPESGPTGIQIQFPTRERIATGQASFRDWPMVSVAVPIGMSWDVSAACPFVSGNVAKYPRFPGDPQATFQFPSQHWLRGLLGGYLDGGEVPINTDKLKCPAIVPTIKTCSAMSPCDMAAGEVCSSGRCLARVPICPVVNEVWLSSKEVTVPTGGATWDPFPNELRTVEIKSMDGTMSRRGDVLASFKALPGQPGFSPVCRVRVFDPTKVTCAAQEREALSPRPLCTATELETASMMTMGAEITLPGTYYIHCLFAGQSKSS